MRNAMKCILLAAPVVALMAALWLIGGQKSAQKMTDSSDSAVVAAASSDSGAANGSFSADQTKSIEKIVRNYLVTNPEVFLEVQKALESKMENEQAARLKVAIKANKADLFQSPTAPVVGNADGDITVIEFFDYNCGYCKRGLSGISKLIESDANVRVVFKELPILSKGSEEAAKVALASRMQGKYWEVHQALLENKGQSNKASALKVAEGLGLDVAKLEADMESADVTKEIDNVRALAQKMGIGGTPHFLVGDRSIPGAPDDLFNVLTKHVADLRKDGCDVC